MDQNTIYTHMMNLTMEIVVIFNEKGKIEFANRRAKDLLGYENMLDSITIDVIFPDAFSCQEEKVVKKFTISDEGMEQMAYRKNRTCFAVNLRVCPLEEGLTACMAIDTSVQTYLEHRAHLADEQMENAELMKTQFVANVTHELRTPVNGILGNVRNLQHMETDPEKKNLMRLIERGCNDMHSIINNILDFSKLDAGKLELDPKEFVFREFMDYIKSTHINKIVDKGLGFFMNISPEVPERIIADELRLGQVLNNLISNAAKFTSAGKITVEVVKTAQRGDKVELFFMVIDTGIGIGIEEQDKLFKSFSQVDAGTFRKYGGTGLGLNISKQLVEMMEGNIHVESQKNKGSMFSFHIWAAIPEDEARGMDGQLHSYQVSVPGMAILEENGRTYQYNTAENHNEIKKKISKLILCIEMKNWEKAEMFMEAIKQLTAEAPQPVRSNILRLKMAVQKEDRDKAMEAYKAFEEIFEGEETV